MGIHHETRSETGAAQVDAVCRDTEGVGIVRIDVGNRPGRKGAVKGQSFMGSLLLAILLVVPWATVARADGEAASDPGTATWHATPGDIDARAERRLFVPRNLALPGGGVEKADPTFPFALGNLPSQSTLTLVYDVEVDAANTWTNFPVTQICNQASLTSANHGTVASDDPDTMALGDTTCTPVDAADLAITKVDSVDPVVAGNNFTYTITVTNSGPQTADGVVVSDTLPAGVTLVSTGGCAEDPVGVPTCTLGSIAAMGMAQYTVTVTVNSDVAGGTVLTNMVGVSALTAESNPGNETASEGTTVQAQADLSITKTDDVDPVIAGNDVTYTIAVSNAGPSDATGVVVTDMLPAGLTLVSTTGCAEDPAGAPTCTLGTIASGGNAQYTVIATVGADVADGTTLSNTASVGATTTLINTGDDSATETTDVIARSDLAITKVDDVDPVTAGNNLVYTITVSNGGPSDAVGVVVSDMLPAGLTLVSTTGCAEDPAGTPTCTLGTLAAGGNAQYTVTATVGADVADGTTLSNTASVTATTTLTNTGDDSATETTDVVTRADLSITKIDDVDPVPAGDPLVYTVTVSNAGPSDAVGVMVSETLPPEVSFVSTSGCVEDPSGVPTCTLGTVAAGQMAAYTVSVTVAPTAGGVITNNVTVSTTTSDPVAGNDSTSENTTVIPGADLSIDKMDSEDPVGGTSFTYTLEVTNNGQSDATNVVATDTLPAGIVFSSSPDGCVEAAGVVTCPFGTITNGATVSRSFVVDLDPPFPGVLSNTATVSGDQADPDPSNNSDTEETTLDVVPPTVTNIETDYGTGDGTLSDCETLNRTWVQGFEVTFSESVADPPGDADPDDVTNPANYLVVAAGPDRSFQTTACGGALGDDVAIGVDSVTYDDGSMTASVVLALELPDDLYRVLVCGSTSITDLAGNSLDGDGDGMGGDDFERSFRVDAANRFANGHFDCDIAQWEINVTNAAEATWSSDDHEGSAESGSLRFENLTASGLFQITQCFDLPELAEYELSGFLRLVSGDGDAIAVGRFCEPFDAPVCGGASLGELGSTVAGVTVGPWAGFGRSFVMPAATRSARCGVRVTTGTGASFIVGFDALLFRNLDGIFGDGFESGDTSQWSDSNP